MLVGHYGPAFAVKALNKSIPLWLLFMAVQFVDVLFDLFAFLGVEKVRSVPGYTATNPFGHGFLYNRLDLYYMPYTHSLVATAMWAVAAMIAYKFVPKLHTWGAAILVAGAVFSHWVLDLLVHRPDLPLYDNTAKVGLGLWNYPVPAFLFEAGVLFGGILLYLKTADTVTQARRYGMIVFGCVMLAIQGWFFFGPPPASEKAGPIIALLLYVAFGGIAYLFERKSQRRVEAAEAAIKKD